jgi:hypothetical protein
LPFAGTAKDSAFSISAFISKGFHRSPDPFIKANPGREVDPLAGAGRMKPQVVCWQFIFNSIQHGLPHANDVPNAGSGFADILSRFSARNRFPVAHFARPGQKHSWTAKPGAIHQRHLLSTGSLLKLPRAQFRRHLERSQCAAPVVSHRRAVRDRE